MTCCVGANTFLAQGKQGREDPVAFVHWTVLLIKSVFLRHLNDKGSLVCAPPGGQKSSIAFKHLRGQPILLVRDKYTTGPSLSALMKSTILRADGQSRKKREQEEETKSISSEDSMWVTGRDGNFWHPTLYPEELVQVVVPKWVLRVFVCPRRHVKH